jgi:type VI secretion system protein ImpM
MSGAVPGWYGKLPTLGDFASRRLDAQWVAQWDDWLAQGLSALREAGDEWLEHYLASPPWCFVLMPGVMADATSVMADAAGSQACAGVLMASVDRVGRYFPLTLVAPLAALPRSAAQLDALLGWLRRLESCAVDAMQDDWSIERLEHALDVLRCPDEAGPATSLGTGSGAAAPEMSVEAAVHAMLGGDAAAVAAAPASRTDLAQLFAAAAITRTHAAAAGVSFWLAASEQPPRLMMARGLPARREFAALFAAAPDAA